MSIFLIAQDRRAPAGLDQQRRRATRGFGRSPGFVDTVSTDFGSADPLGDDQAERTSAWGALQECAPEGGKHRGPSRTLTDAPSGWFVTAVALCCAAVLIGSLLARYWH